MNYIRLTNTKNEMYVHETKKIKFLNNPINNLNPLTIESVKQKLKMKDSVKFSTFSNKEDTQI